MKTKLLMLLLSCICMTAMANEHPKYLVVWEKDGTKTTYALRENPKVTFSESSLVVAKDGATTSFPMDNVHHFTYETMMKGDVNEDAKVDIVDVTSTISHILSMPPEDFSSESADMNGDGKVDIVDVTTMIDIILKGPEAAQPISDNLNTGEAFFIYRNDDQFNAFFRDEVGSITYSNYDADGVYHDNIVSQTVTTPDSIYQIPLTAIESVGFVQPETVYEENTTELSGSILDYIVSVDNYTIYLRSDTPDELIPEIGQKLAQLEFSDVFRRTRIFPWQPL